MRKPILSILDHLMDTLSDAIFLKDGEGRWIYANSNALNLFDLTNVVWEGKTDQELSVIKPQFRGTFLKCFKDDTLAWEMGTALYFEETVTGIDR